MTYTMRFMRFARHCSIFALHFAHGGLLMAGVMVVVLVGYRLSNHGIEGLNPHTLFSSATEDDALPASELLNGTQVIWASSKGMSPELTRLAQYIARRYRVSQLVVEPLVVAAVREGRSTGVDPLLILAVTSVESGFNPLSESVVGAQGLMQIIPRFHLDKISSEKGKTALFDPNENFRVGAMILKEYIRSNGDLEAGLQQYGGAPDDPAMIYSGKVLTELERLKQVMKFGNTRAEVANETSPAAPPPVQATEAEKAS